MPPLPLLVALLQLVCAASAVAGARRQLYQAPNTDSFLLYSTASTLDAWNSTDKEAARALNATATGSFVLAQGAVSLGSVLVDGRDNRQPSIRACAASCAGWNGCDIFNFCPPGPERCVVGTLGMALLGGSCELRSQQDIRLGRGMFVTSASRGMFTGAPISVAAAAVAGYSLHKGIAFVGGQYNYECDATFKRGICMVLGTPEELAAACNADRHCVGFLAYPNGSSDLMGYAMGYLLAAPSQGGTLDIGWTYMNPSSILYVNTTTLLRPSPSPAFEPPLASVEAVTPSGAGSKGIAQPQTTEQPGDEPKSLKGLSLAGVIVGAGVAAAVLGALAGYVVYRRRAAARASIPPVSPAKLRSLYSSSIAAASVSPLGRHSACKLSSTAARTASVVTTEMTAQARPDPSSSSEGGPLEVSPSKEAISKLFHGVENPQWMDCVVSAASIAYDLGPDGQKIKLGSGACGTVYRVTHDDSQVIAAKVVGLVDVKNFIQETAVLRKLRHPNVVQFMGVAASEGEGIILMEFMCGGDLGRHINSRTKDGKRAFGWYQRGSRIMLEVSQGLSYLHRNKVIHFDLKPQNILLTGGPGYTAKLGDYGFARIKQKTLLTKTDLDGRVGTWTWCAPEVLMGLPCDEKADVYSLGVILWEICTGEPPMRGQMQPLRAPEHCPQEVVDLQESCVSHDPAERPTAKQVLMTLAQLCAPSRQLSRHSPAPSPTIASPSPMQRVSTGGGGMAAAAAAAMAEVPPTTDALAGGVQEQM